MRYVLIALFLVDCGLPVPTLVPTDPSTATAEKMYHRIEDCVNKCNMQIRESEE